MNQLSENDRAMVDALRQSPSATMHELIEAMGVTATAVRQRLDRLMAAGLVDRTHESEGRGRPSYRYHLTDAGRNSGGNNLSDLAIALWKELAELDDQGLRQRIVAGAFQRLSRRYEEQVAGRSPEQRLAEIARIFAAQDIPISFEKVDGVATVKLDGCPYPGLVDSDQVICEMEQEMLASVVGTPVDRCQCQKDGDQCCSFQEQGRTQQSEASVQGNLVRRDQAN